MSLKKEIYDCLKARSPEFVHKGELGKKAVMEWGFLNENAGRRRRELCDEGLIEKEIRKGCVWYRFKEEESFIIKEMRKIREKAEREKELKNFNSTGKLF